MSVSAVIEVLRARTNKYLMQELNFKLQKICRMWPPAKNENKFIYGKLCEKAIIETIDSCNDLTAIDLDASHASGSEYKNDVQIIDNRTSFTKNFSIKASKGGGRVTLINCKSTNKHNISDLSVIIAHINSERLYIFDHGPDFEKHNDTDTGSISYKGSIFTLLKKPEQQLKYAVQLPSLSEAQRRTLNGVQKMHTYDDLYALV